uniref:Metalloendopeptidase n=1 Tax=Parastrongyloides trichosuri TaxID=131310 RepID=A0A0N4Z8F9_PARTI
MFLQKILSTVLTIFSSLLQLEYIGYIDDYRENITTFNGTNPLKVYIPSYMNMSLVWKGFHIYHNKTLLGFERTNFTVNTTLGFNFQRALISRAPVGPSKRDNKTFEFIKLTKKCENQTGTIEQLIAKMLGIINTNNRPDRDYYIKINYSNIYNGPQKLFKKYNWSQVPLYVNVSYDFGSALHYSPLFMSNNSLPVLMPHDNYSHYNNMIGQQYELSFNDLKLVNLIYSAHNCRRNNHCYNGGYMRPYFCHECLCPNGYTGTHCNLTESSSSGCNGNNTQKANTTVQTITMNGNINCTYLIKTNKNSTIEVNITDVKTQAKSPCYQKMGLEVKHFKDKGATGLCLCGNYSNITLTSENHKVLIQYTGLNNSSSANISFKEIKPTTTTTPPVV